MDKDNIALLVKFIKKWNDEKDSTNVNDNVSKPQILMISHQEEALSQCDSLIGVTQQEFFKSSNEQIVNTDSKFKFKNVDDDKNDLNA